MSTTRIPNLADQAAFFCCNADFDIPAPNTVATGGDLSVVG
ncbi:hypothetical protein [Stackebrandtia soli]